MASQFRRFAAALMGSSALVLTGAALAQDAPSSNAPVYLEADHLEDLNGGGYLATGNVRVRQDGRTLMADELEYHPERDRVIARGHVVITGQTPYPQYADEVELDSALASGVALGFASLLENNGRLAAAAAIRDADQSLTLRQAYYTACELCEDGEGEPTWRLRAREVRQDAEEQMIYYRDARFEFMGVPVLYAPVFSHADPSSERRSGFLFPKVGVSSRLGFVFQQPYLWSISPSQDLVIAPRYMGNFNPLLYGEYRKRFWSGFVDFEASVTHETDIDSDGERFGEEAWRWHVFGGGRFRIAEDWRWGFGIQRIHDSEDDLYLRRYDFSETLKDYGQPIEALSRQLVSQLYLENRTETRYASVIAAGYQSVRANVNDDTLPVIAPQMSVRQVFTAPEGWGRVNLDANATVLTRSDGVDYTRASTALDWRTRWIAPGGLVVEPFALGRVDYYELGDLPVAGGAPDSDSFSRQLGLVGTEVSWPFYRGGETVDTIIEPVVSLVAATDDPESNRLVNEDSLTLDLDESLLFQPVRASGYDLWEEGVRANYGLRATAFWGDGGFARAFVGRSERLDGDAVFSATSGLFEEQSDYVVTGEIDWGAFALEIATRLDTEDFDVNTLQFDASFDTERLSVTLGYLDSSDDAAVSRRGPQRELRFNASLQLTSSWSLLTNNVLDLDAETTRRSQIGFMYEDECSQFEILYQREDTGIAALGPSESIQFRITLLTLGSVDPDS
ncbi:LPS-assembly protein LptD [Maricaulis parjimensis]|uniref:LPS-assembly protein LptD n=1 Tax=Maricaulis parjimensis TaxID=144023 RepID=UPI00193A4B1B|nr:LPS assembly protein LptD [Maricaulis parjimensis]